MQKDGALPAALRKERVLRLAARGAIFRENLLYEVNALLDRCKIYREAFTGKLKVDCPASIVDAPIRILQCFIAGLSRIYQSERIEQFTLHGSQEDMVSEYIIRQFVDPAVEKFNVLSLNFRKIPTLHHDNFFLLVTPEAPRRKYTNKLSLTIESDDTEWKVLRCESDEISFLPATIKMLVRKDRGYYIRPLRATDTPAIKLVLPQPLKLQFLNGLNRSRDYPRGLFTVLCHQDGEEEIYDSLPQFGIDLSEDVKSSCSGNFDLKKPNEEWTELKRGQEYTPEKTEDRDGVLD